MEKQARHTLAIPSGPGRSDDELEAGRLVRFWKEKCPSTGWGTLCDTSRQVCGLSEAFRVASIVNYFLLRQAADGLPADDTRNLESSYRLYCRSFVHDGEICATDHSKKLFMRFKCKATMKSNVRYSLRAMFQRQNLLTPLQLVYADCSCPAGAPRSTCNM